MIKRYPNLRTLYFPCFTWIFASRQLCNACCEVCVWTCAEMCLSLIRPHTVSHLSRRTLWTPTQASKRIFTFPSLCTYLKCGKLPGAPSQATPALKSSCIVCSELGYQPDLCTVPSYITQCRSQFNRDPASMTFKLHSFLNANNDPGLLRTWFKPLACLNLKGHLIISVILTHHIWPHGLNAVLCPNCSGTICTVVILLQNYQGRLCYT